MLTPSAISHVPSSPSMPQRHRPSGKLGSPLRVLRSEALFKSPQLLVDSPASSSVNDTALPSHPPPSLLPTKTVRKKSWDDTLKDFAAFKLSPKEARTRKENAERYNQVMRQPASIGGTPSKDYDWSLPNSPTKSHSHLPKFSVTSKSEAEIRSEVDFEGEMEQYRRFSNVTKSQPIHVEPVVAKPVTRSKAKLSTNVTSASANVNSSASASTLTAPTVSSTAKKATNSTAKPTEKTLKGKATTTTTQSTSSLSELMDEDLAEPLRALSTGLAHLRSTVCDHVTTERDEFQQQHEHDSAVIVKNCVEMLSDITVGLTKFVRESESKAESERVRAQIYAKRTQTLEEKLQDLTSTLNAQQSAMKEMKTSIQKQAKKHKEDTDHLYHEHRTLFTLLENFSIQDALSRASGVSGFHTPRVNAAATLQAATAPKRVSHRFQTPSKRFAMDFVTPVKDENGVDDGEDYEEDDNNGFRGEWKGRSVVGELRSYFPRQQSTDTLMDEDMN